MNLFPLLAQNDDAGGAIAGLFGLVCNCGMLVFVIVAIVGMWKTFEKAGQPGWAAIIPFYNMYVLTVEIARKEILWFILMLLPCINIVAMILVSIDVAKNFGKGPGFGIGLALLPAIFFPILGFGDARYQPVASPVT
jgi:hypothetical protein